MNLKEIEETILREIPIVEKMGVKFLSFQDFTATTLTPLLPNHNHKNTVFGGSLYSVCTATCYGLMYFLQVKESFHEYDLVIGEGSIRYSRPVEGDFKVMATIDPIDWREFLQTVQATGFGKIPVKAHAYIKSDSQKLCSYWATFVLKKRN